MAAQELDDIGEVAIEEADIVGDWARPSRSTSRTRPSASSTATGWWRTPSRVGADRGDAAVHPDYRGRGIGTALARWMQDTARRRGATVVGMPVPQGSAGDRLLEALGYHVRWDELGAPAARGRRGPEPRRCPTGYTVRAAEPDGLRAPCWTVQEDAFLEWSVRDRQTFEDWESSMTRRPGFEPWNLRVVLDPAGDGGRHGHGAAGGRRPPSSPGSRPRKDQRGQGLGPGAARRRVRGRPASTAPLRSELSTDSRTGALGLYEKVGMVVTSTWVNRAVDL